MTTEKVFIYTELGGNGFSGHPEGSLLDILPRITLDNEYSFAGAGMFSHGHCMEASIGRRPHETYIEVRELLHSGLRMPCVMILDLGRMRNGTVEEITRARRWWPFVVFVLYCTTDEYDSCVAGMPYDWKSRMSRFLRLAKNGNRVDTSQLRTLLDAATKTAIEKGKNAVIFSAFISYSHSDSKFARWLHDALSGHGVKCWLDEKQLRAGDRIHSKVESAIHERDKILLCASRASLTSWWVDNEINSVITKEQRLWKEKGEETLALIPLNLDGSLFSDVWRSGWKSQVVSRLAPDFTQWNSERTWESNDAFSSVLQALVFDPTVRDNPFYIA